MRAERISFRRWTRRGRKGEGDAFMLDVVVLGEVPRGMSAEEEMGSSSRALELALSAVPLLFAGECWREERRFVEIPKPVGGRGRPKRWTAGASLVLVATPENDDQLPMFPEGMTGPPGTCLAGDFHPTPEMEESDDAGA